MMHCTNRLRLPLTLITAMALSGCALLGLNHPTVQKPTPQQPVAHKPANPVLTPKQRFAAAMQLMKHHQTKQAIAAFQALSDSQPKDSGPATNLGILYLHQKQWQLALQAYEHAVLINPKNGVAYLGMGIAYRHMNAYASAKQAYEKALALKTDPALAHYDLAILYDVYLHQPVDAVKQYRAYMKANGKQDLIVTAWIKGLEQQPGVSAALAKSNPPKQSGGPKS